jgi:hypothetical protein
MEHSPSWKGNSYWISQENLRLLCKPKVHYRVHNSLPLVPIQSQFHPMHTRARVYRHEMKFPEWFHFKPHTCILTAYWEGPPPKYSPWAGMHLSQRYCHSFGNILGSSVVEWLSAIVTFFLCLQYSQIFVPVRQTLFLEAATSPSEANQMNRVGVLFQ